MSTNAAWMQFLRKIKKNKNTLLPTKRLLNVDDGSQSSKVQVHKRARKQEKSSLKAPLMNLQT